jgi:hypothetical protein
MRSFASAVFVAAILAIPASGPAQEVAPIFEQVPAVMYETYSNINQPAFNEYFEMLVAKYTESGGHGWAIYFENPKVAHRITVLEDGLATVPGLQRARVESFQEFNEAQMELWNSAWGSRHAAIYSTAPNLSYVPEGFTVDDIRRLPYVRTRIHYLKWNQAGAFRQALARRGELDREAGIDNLVLTAWNGGLGAVGQSVMIRVSAESLMADREALAERMEIRQGYWDEWIRLTRIMNDATWKIETHDQTRVNDLSYPALSN